MQRRSSDGGLLRKKQEQWAREKEESANDKWFPFGSPGGGNPNRKHEARDYEACAAEMQQRALEQKQQKGPAGAEEPSRPTPSTVASAAGDIKRFPPGPCIENAPPQDPSISAAGCVAAHCPPLPMDSRVSRSHSVDTNCCAHANTTVMPVPPPLYQPPMYVYAMPPHMQYPHINYSQMMQPGPHSLPPSIYSAPGAGTAAAGQSPLVQYHVLPPGTVPIPIQPPEGWHHHQPHQLPTSAPIAQIEELTEDRQSCSEVATTVPEAAIIPLAHVAPMISVPPQSNQSQMMDSNYNVNKGRRQTNCDDDDNIYKAQMAERARLEAERERQEKMEDERREKERREREEAAREEEHRKADEMKRKEEERQRATQKVLEELEKAKKEAELMKKMRLRRHVLDAPDAAERECAKLGIDSVDHLEQMKKSVDALERHHRLEQEYTTKHSPAKKKDGSAERATSMPRAPSISFVYSTDDDYHSSSAAPSPLRRSLSMRQRPTPPPKPVATSTPVRVGGIPPSSSASGAKTPAPPPSPFQREAKARYSLRGTPAKTAMGRENRMSEDSERSRVPPTPPPKPKFDSGLPSRRSSLSQTFRMSDSDEEEKRQEARAPDVAVRRLRRVHDMQDVVGSATARREDLAAPEERTSRVPDSPGMPRRQPLEGLLRERNNNEEKEEERAVQEERKDDEGEEDWLTRENVMYRPTAHIPPQTISAIKEGYQRSQIPVPMQRMRFRESAAPSSASNPLFSPIPLRRMTRHHDRADSMESSDSTSTSGSESLTGAGHGHHLQQNQPLGSAAAEGMTTRMPSSGGVERGVLQPREKTPISANLFKTPQSLPVPRIRVESTDDAIPQSERRKIFEPHFSSRPSSPVNGVRDTPTGRLNYSQRVRINSTPRNEECLSPSLQRKSSLLSGGQSTCSLSESMRNLRISMSNLSGAGTPPPQPEEKKEELPGLSRFHSRTPQYRSLNLRRYNEKQQQMLDRLSALRDRISASPMLADRPLSRHPSNASINNNNNNTFSPGLATKSP